MKRTITIVLLCLLVVSSSLLFVACNGSGGVKTEQDWNDAMDFLKNCDTVTITCEKDEYTNLHIKQELTKWTVTYDAVNGELYSYRVIENYNVGVFDQRKHHQTYAVVDGSDFKIYTKDTVDSAYKPFDAKLTTCDNNEAALLKLKELFYSYLKEFDLNTLQFSDYKFKQNKFEKTETNGQSSAVWQITFADKKLNKIYIEGKPQKGSQSIDHAKITFTILYSAEVTAPNGLENAIWK